VAYDEQLAQRVRQLLADTAGVTERKMFGGLAFLIEGHMAVVASGRGGLMVRVGPDLVEELVLTTSARFAEMRGRQMRGWLRLDSDQVRHPRQLTKWVEIGTEFAAALPPKA
jgi:TfoX/Sxy family transcriptional regulator of competence genes